jgi:hypothetical protein
MNDYRVKTVLDSEKKDVNEIELMLKILRQFLSNVTFSMNELKQFHQLLRDCVNYFSNNELIRPYSKVLNSFIKASNEKIDEFSSNENLNFLEDICPLESIKGPMYKLYSEYIHCVVSDKTKLKSILKIVPFLLNRLPHEVHRKDIDESLRCLESIATYIGEEFQEYYDLTLKTYSNLLNNSLISVGTSVILSLEKILLLKIQMKKFSTIEPILFKILKNDYKEDKRPIEFEDDEDDEIDVESEFILSTLHVFHSLLSDKDLISHGKYLHLPIF